MALATSMPPRPARSLLKRLPLLPPDEAVEVAAAEEPASNEEKEAAFRELCRLASDSLAAGRGRDRANGASHAALAAATATPAAAAAAARWGRRRAWQATRC